MYPFGVPGVGVAAPPQGQSMIAGLDIQKVIRRYGEQAYWSALRYTAGQAVASTNQRSFTTPLNQQGQGFGRPLSIAETNQRESGRISSQRAFTTKAIACQVWNEDTSPIVYQDVLNFLANSVLQWRFNEAIIEVAPTWLVPAGGGVYGDTADTGNGDGALGSREALNNGNGGVWIYTLIPITLPAGTTFAMEQVWGDGAPTIDGRSVVGGVANETPSAVISRICLIGPYQVALASA